MRAWKKPNVMERGSVPCFSVFSRPNHESAPVALLQSQEFLVFGIRAHDGFGSLHESGAVVGDDLKLAIAMNVASQRQRFASLATPQAMAFQKLRHDGDTHAKASPQKFLGNLGT